MASSSLSTSALNALIQADINVNASRYVCAAAVVVMFYDWLLTLPSEIDTVWKSRKTFVSYLFFINRYLPFPIILLFNYHIAEMRPAVTDTLYVSTRNSSFAHLVWYSCKGEITIMVFTTNISVTIASWLLSLRVISLWNRHPLVVYSIYAAYATVTVTFWSLLADFLYHMYPTIAYDVRSDLCLASNVNAASGAYLASVSFEVYIFVLQVIHHYMYLRVRRSHKLPTFTLLRTLYQDGYFYFIVVVSLRLMTCVVWAVAPSSLWYMPNQLEYAMTSALTCRFHIHLRAAASPSNHVTSTVELVHVGQTRPHNQTYLDNF